MSKRTAHNSTLPAPDKPLKRKTPLRPVNSKRKAARQDDPNVFGAFYVWLKKTQGCVVGGRWVSASDTCMGAVAGHHLKSRGAGGTDMDGLAALCAKHHTEVHTIGRTAFEQKYQTDLDLEHARCYGEWCDLGKPGEPAADLLTHGDGGDQPLGSPTSTEETDDR